jgi:high-affinity nickel-transport protein
LVSFLVCANVVAWAWALAAFAERPLVLGTALLAWVFGLRHAVDADHIAAIDNAVRKLMQDGRQPVATGFYFSLGHSTVVILACLVIVATAGALKPKLAVLQLAGGVVGTSVSAAFLLLVGLLNAGILAGVWRDFRKVTAGQPIDSETFDALIASRGFLARLFRPLFAVVSRSWHMYPVGFLFGLGFDTATEVALLALSASQAAQGMSPWQVMVFPALFTAGMALVDTADSAMMVRAYGWAFEHPLRKLWYNLTITAASVAVALLIGGIEAAGLLADELGLSGGVWAWIGRLSQDLSAFGFVIVAIFAATWGLSALTFRLGGYARLKR